MFSRGAQNIGAGLVAGALIATMATGITYAATTGAGAKACVSGKGVLALLDKHGKCPSRDSKTTIGAAGPRGSVGRRGIQGKPGPAVAPHLYYDRERSDVSLGDTGTTVASVAVPAGTYEVNFVVDLASSSTAVSAYCTASTPTEGGPGHDAAFEGPNAGYAYGQSVGSDVFTLPAAGTISLTCADSTNIATFDASGSQFLSALPLGSTN